MLQEDAGQQVEKKALRKSVINRNVAYKRAKWPAQPPSNWNRKAHACLSAILHIHGSPTSC